MDFKDADKCSYVFDKPEPIMLSVLPIIPYPKFIPIILSLFPSHHLLYLLFFKF